MTHRALTTLLPLAAVSALLTAPAAPGSAGSEIAVGPQYDTTHVYVERGTLSAFTAGWQATFGGTATAVDTVKVTPTPSETESALLLSPVGTLSVFDFLTPVPYPFGSERTGRLLKDFDDGIKHARSSDADLLVAPFRDPLGRDAVVQFPGGVNTQVYWHTKAPHYRPLETVPENRVYVTGDAAGEFLDSYLEFTGGSVTKDEPGADGADIGLPGGTYRRISVASPFGRTLVAVTDGHLPYPFGREVTGCEVKNLTATLAKARAAGAQVLWGPHASKERDSAMVRFPGGYIAEIHDVAAH